MTSQSVTGDVADVESFVSKHLKRNFTALLVDYGLFNLGLTFASVSTIVPAFAERLGASNLIIGAIPSVMTVGYYLPPLFFANHTERLPRKLRFILTYTIWERVPLLLLAVCAYTLSVAAPGLALAAVLISLLLMSGVGGALTPAWMDLIGKVVPTNYRGRLFAYANLLGAGLGVVGTIATGYFLSSYEFPIDYTLCFGTGFLFLIGSYVALSLTAEPSLASGKPQIGLSEYLRQLPAILRRDRNFTWYLAARSLATVSAMANGFYTVFALRTYNAPEYLVATFTLVLLASQTLAYLLFGWVADRIGHKPVLVVGTASAAIGNVVAAAGGRLESIYVVFVCMAVGIAAINTSALNMSLEYASPADRPTYVGLASTLIAPFAFATPLIAGSLADSAGYPAVFVVAGVVALLASLVMFAQVRDPRRLARVA